MRHRYLNSMMVPAAVVAVLLLAQTPAAGQVPTASLGPPASRPTTTVGGCPTEPLAFHKCALAKEKAFNPPRTPDGRPDMQGYWRNGLTNGFSVEGIAETDPLSRNLVQAATVGPGMIVDPPDGKIPYQAWATTIGKDIKLWGGDPVGRWNGNTLVVDVTNTNGYTWLDDQGNFYIDAAHMVERWTMIDPDTIHYQVTIEDPQAYTRSWTMAWALERIEEPGLELIEEACWEGDRDLPHLRSLGYQSYFGQPWKSR